MVCVLKEVLSGMDVSVHFSTLMGSIDSISPDFMKELETLVPSEVAQHVVRRCR